MQFPTHELPILPGPTAKVNQFGVRRARIDGMRKFLTRVFGLGALAAAASAVWRKLSDRSGAPGLNWEPQPFPYPPHPRSEPEPAVWIDPATDGTCPASHPVKAKLASGIFHVSGGANYERTAPDRCYLSPEAAIADGLRAAKR